MKSFFPVIKKGAVNTAPEIKQYKITFTKEKSFELIYQHDKKAHNIVYKCYVPLKFLFKALLLTSRGGGYPLCCYILFGYIRFISQVSLYPWKYTA